MRRASHLSLKLSWLKRLHDGGTVTGKALTCFIRELYEAGDTSGIVALTKGLGWRLTDKDIVDVGEHRTRVDGDSFVGFRVVPNEQN